MNRVEQDCTARCHSAVHAAQVVAAVTKGSSSEIKAFCRWLCHCFAFVLDVHGRNALHAAASCNKWEVVQWLLQQCGAAADVRDAESGWTALHRSLFYGQLTAARHLLMHGANFHITDHEGLSPLDVVVRDRLPHVEYLPSSPLEVYIWGPNSNFNLGLDTEQGRVNPELLECFRSRNIHIQQVCMCEFHTIFLSRDHRVFTCGHGQGGRLGQKSEKTCLAPAPVKDLDGLKCVAVAGGLDHTVLLVEGGQVWTCGLNSYHQLGHVPPPERLLSPRLVTSKLLSRHTITGICAARYHTVLYASDAVYTFGLNAGQLGHPKGDRTQVAPRLVSTFHQKDWSIALVAASDGATVCGNSLGDVFLLANYQCRKIASKWLNIKKVSVVGGHLDSQGSIADGGGTELRIALLTTSGKVFLWTETNSVFTRCTFSVLRPLIVRDVHASQSSFAVVTSDGEGFVGCVAKKRDSAKTDRTVPSPAKKAGPALLISAPNREDCIQLQVKRLPFMFRATGITSDPKGKNFAALQTIPITGVYELPSVSASSIQSQFGSLLEEADLVDDLHDIVVRVGSRRFPGHRYILASRCEFFRKKITADGKNRAGDVCVEGMTGDCFARLQKFIYCNSYDFVNCASPSASKPSLLAQQQDGASNMASKSESKEEPVDVLGAAIKGCQRLGLSSLCKRLEVVKLVGGKVAARDIDPLPKLRFSRKVMPSLSDVTLCSEDGATFNCHRCVLVARSEYFRGMLAPAWFEASTAQLKLPFEAKILDAVLDYIYTDEADKLQGCDDVEFLCRMLAMTDQLLMMRLKEMVELNLVDLITLKNVTDLLQLSSMYNADQLKATCLQYICINLPALLESGSLERLDDNIMEDLTAAYKKLIPAMSRRVITPYADGPCREELAKVALEFPVDDNVIIPMPAATPSRVPDHKPKPRRAHASTGNDGTKAVDKHTATRVSGNAASVQHNCNRTPEAKPVMIKEEVDTAASRPSRAKPEPPSPASIKDQCSWPQLTNSPPQLPDLKHVIERQQQASQRPTSKFADAKWDGKLERLSQKQRKRLGKSISSDNSDDSPSVTTSPEPRPNAWLTGTNQNIGNTATPTDFGTKAVRTAWQTDANAASSDVPNLTAILQTEQELLQRRHRQQTAKPKSLHIISLEDQAVEQLLKLYNAHDNPEERIVVEHITPEKIAPVWKKHA